ncbi:MAG: uroporphyrinogen-III synthase, partial [Nitrospinae bacterium]|nr:uroporphyrinogen-III synthase [Nitrospinota bacterium]
KEGSLDVIAFTASSTVKNFMELMGEDCKDELKKIAIACIGPITAQTAQDLGLKVDVVPTDYTIESLVQAIEDFYSE